MQRFKQQVMNGVPAARADRDSVYWKKDSDVPDYSEQIDKQMELNREFQADALAAYQQAQTDTLMETKRQYDEMAPLIKDVTKAQTGIMEDARAQGNDYYNYMKDTYRPIEQGLIKDANDYNSKGMRDQLAGKAAADVEGQAAIQKQASAREMARMGVNPNSGRFRGMDAARGLQTAGMRAGAMTGARERAEQIGYARKLDVVGMGRGLPGASTAAYGAATGAGNSAVGNQTTGANFAMNGLNTANNYAVGGANVNLNAGQNTLSNLTSLQGQSIQANANKTNGTDLLGMIGGAWAGSGFDT